MAYHVNISRFLRANINTILDWQSDDDKKNYLFSLYILFSATHSTDQYAVHGFYSASVYQCSVNIVDWTSV